MRKRDEIMKLEGHRDPIVNPNYVHSEILEVLLDIRDILSQGKGEEPIAICTEIPSGVTVRGSICGKRLPCKNHPL